MEDFSQMTDTQKRAWALDQAIRKATLEEAHGDTVKRAEAFHAYVFTSAQDETPRSVLPLREAS